MLKLKTKEIVSKAVYDALAQDDKLRKIQDASVKKLIGNILFTKVSGLDPRLHIKKSFATFSMHEPMTILTKTTKIALATSEDADFNANLIASAIKHFATGLLDVNAHEDSNGIYEVKSGLSDDAHSMIEAEISGLDAVSLAKADTWYQATLSTGSGSRYSFMAKHKHKDAKLAIRLRGSSVSVRMEPTPAGLDQDINFLGLNPNSGYASVHFEAEGVSLIRYIKMMVAGLENWEVAPFNEQKIREVSA